MSVRFAPVNASTPFGWAFASLPALSVLGTVAFLTLGGYHFTYFQLSPMSHFTPGHGASIAISAGAWIGGTVLARLDHNELSVRGLVKPFDWGWAFLPVVYIIGRSVQVHRRTHRGTGPLWLWIGLTLLGWIVQFVSGFAIWLQRYNDLGLLVTEPVSSW